MTLTPLAVCFAQSNYQVYQGLLYFGGRLPQKGEELLRCDGQQVQIAADITSGPDSSHVDDLAVWQDTLYFSAKKDPHGRDLWRFDGAAASLVADMDPSTFSPSYLTPLNDRLYFRGMAPEGLRMFEYDGSTLSVVNGFTHPASLVVWNDALYFWASNGPNTSGLWRYDGEQAELVFEHDTELTELTVFQDQLYFVAGGAPITFGMNRLWTFDGTAAAPVGTTPLSPGANLVVYNNRLYGWDVDAHLIEFDETLERRIPFVEGNSSVRPVVYRGELYFAAEDGRNGYGLWKYDGTMASFLSDVDTGAAIASFWNLVTYCDGLFFVAPDSQATKFWKYTS